METPRQTPEEVKKTIGLEAVVLGRASEPMTTEGLLRKLDFYSSLENPNLGYVEARVLCHRAAAKIRELQSVFLFNEPDDEIKPLV